MQVVEAGPWRVGIPFSTKPRRMKHEPSLTSSLVTEGTIVLSPISNTEPCTRLLNESCFGQCLGALKVRQEGPLHNTTSEAESLGFMRNKNCTCMPGYGRYDEGNQTATWVTREDYHGLLVPRVLDVAVVPVEGMIVVQHRDQPLLRHCFFMYEVLSGSVMGLGDDQPSTPSQYSQQVLPVWAAIVCAMGGVLVLAMSAMLIFRRRALSDRAAAGRSQATTEEEEDAAAEAPSLRDPLLD